jgi:hypothetical protein
MHTGRWLKEASRRLVEADQDFIAPPGRIGKAIVGGITPECQCASIGQPGCLK